MNKYRLFFTIFVATISLSACADTHALKESFRATGNSIDRLVHGVFYAQIDKSNIEKVNNATVNALDSIGNYNISDNETIGDISNVTGTTKNNRQAFNIDLKQVGTATNLYIKIGTFGNKSASVNLLSKIRSNLG